MLKANSFSCVSLPPDGFSGLQFRSKEGINLTIFGGFTLMQTFVETTLLEAESYASLRLSAAREADVR